MPMEDELPEDINHWPTDPYVLIGITSGASRRDLKRAYTKLIRRFKPEHFPEQFRRLREAYESLDNHLEWRELREQRFPEPIDPAKTSESRDPDSRELTRPSEKHSHSSNDSPHRRDDTGIDAFESIDLSDVSTPLQLGTESDSVQLWQQFLDGGDLGLIYGKLQEVSSHSALSETGYLQLYWILTLSPGLNIDRDPCSWLLEAVRQHGLSRQLQSILSIEARRRSGKVPVLLTEDLLDQIRSASQVVKFLEARWYVARRTWRFDVIKDDLERFRKRFLDEPIEWAALLQAAVRQLVMVQSDSESSILVAVQGDLKQSLNGLEFNWLWDWCDSTIALHKAWLLSRYPDHCIPSVTMIHCTDLNGHPMTLAHCDALKTRSLLERLSSLTMDTWDRSSYQILSDLQAFCFDLTKVPEESLSHLLAINQVVRPLLGYLLQLLQEQLFEANVEENYGITDATRRDLKAFVCRNLWAYRRWEITVLKFCLDAAVTPNEVATTLEEFADQLPDNVHELGQTIRNHLPLQCLVLAQRVVWST